MNFIPFNNNITKNIKTCIFQKFIPPLNSGYIDYEVTNSCTIVGVQVNFTPGESATLQIRPTVIINSIEYDIIEYANTNQYIIGDNMNFSVACYKEVPANSKLRINFNNTGDFESFVNANIQFVNN